MDNSAYETLLDAIYGTCHSFDEWRSVLDLLMQAFQCHVVTIIERNSRTVQGRNARAGIDPFSPAEYFAWDGRNVFVSETRDWHAGAIHTDQQLVSRSELIKTDYYNGFLKVGDMGPMLRLTLAYDDSQKMAISLFRPPQGTEFESGEVGLAEKLMPHLLRATRVARRFSDSRLDAQTGFALIEQNPTGVVLIDGNGQVIFANRAAREMAGRGDGLLLRRNQIDAERSGERARLKLLIAGAIGKPSGVESPRGGSLRVTRSTGARDYIVTVGSLPIARGPLEETKAAAFVLISDPDAVISDLGPVLRQVYDLTPTEARLAERLARGESIDDAAESLEIRSSTAKWHLRSLFNKTGVNRQSELIRLLTALHTAGH